ncbi:uncharacterized protein LOC126968325 [Leptidea sinapis]|uniref:uncharacterized protein LOC126968325 n=1 Tax=Leptidea sinapis TaxID=189913 RepID=UPI0021243849|nr:uncharacterized protein LOC126968325 [Leptidea sinapis]
MSFNVNWIVDKYREEHESDEHWLLRKAFMERWKNNYPEERLVCLARVFTNMEFMGCRYPLETMQEVATLSKEVAKEYRLLRKTKLQRTFVSASDAAGDRAKGIKREGGVIVEAEPTKKTKILFVPQGTEVVDLEESVEDETIEKDCEIDNFAKTTIVNDYAEEMSKVNCLNVKIFRDDMFMTEFGRFVLLIRPWTGKMSNIQSSCQSSQLSLDNTYYNNCYKLTLNGKLLAEATGPTKVEAKNIVEMMAWNRLKENTVSLLIKEQWRSDGDKISMSDVAGEKERFGTPVENTVATKMMKLMGWKGGGLGADAQGIAEPIKPNLQMVNRAGLGSNSRDIRQLRLSGTQLMQRFLRSSLLDVDLVFSNEFSKEERAVLHLCAKKAGLASKSYGGDADRFLVVKKKLDPFSLVRAVVDKGGNTAKYQVFIPASMARR